MNAILAVAKLSAGLLGHSYALVADAVESLADIFSSVVVWRGLVIAAALADAEHPYGHGKAEPIAAAIVATTTEGSVRELPAVSNFFVHIEPQGIAEHRKPTVRPD